MKQLVDYSEAKERLEANAAKMIGSALAKPLESLLNSESVESEYYWIFFLSDDVEFKEPKPTEQGGLHPPNWAYLITKDGSDIRQVYDLSHEPEKMEEHLDSLNQHFE